jgi:photosystem II stability/assembly factor-like uncharacterized protein
VKSIAKTLFALSLLFGFAFFAHDAFAAVLPPGSVSSCGELAAPGTYTLTANLVAVGTSSCFIVSSDGVTIDGAGHSISGTGSWGIDARAYNSGNVVLKSGANGFTNLLVNELTVAGFSGGINASGNSDLTGTGSNAGYGGDGGDVEVLYSTVGSVSSNGGASVTQPYGGIGGNLIFTGDNLNLSGSSLSVLAGAGTTGRNTDGGLDVNYAGAINHAGVALSSLSFFNENSVVYGAYAGGTWPIAPGTISSCGTLLGSGTYTLSQNLSGISGTCFTLASNNITINGAGYSISSNSSSTQAFAIVAGSYSGLTIASTTISSYPNMVISSSSVLITGGNLDLSNKFIAADSLSLSYSGILNKVGTTVTAFSALTINGTSYGATPAGTLPEWTPRDSNRNWYAIAPSVDGMKLAAIATNGRIYTSTDSGVTWTARDSSRNWLSIASSADGTKLVSVVGSGQIYTSTDSGVTWTARDSNREWQVVASSADGTKLVATVQNGRIYTSTDSGVTWTARDSIRSWRPVASSADGTKLVAADSTGRIYTSTDSGVTWTARDSNRGWQGVASSADGTKLIAVVYGGQIYTSTDSGATWMQRDSDRNWWSVSSSADGTVLAAAVNGGRLYVSTDSGVTWVAQDQARSWTGVAVSPDGARMAAVAYGSQVYTYDTVTTATGVAVFVPGVVSAWAPFVLWGQSTSCYYSFDGFVSTSTSNCTLNGSDIPNPGYGSQTLSVRGIDAGNIIRSASASFSFPLRIAVNAPVAGASATAWEPSVIWNAGGFGLMATCQYSYNDFAATSTADCASAGADIALPTVSGSSTLYLRAVTALGAVGTTSVSFSYDPAWVARGPVRDWRAIASSADGRNLVAAVNNGQIYVSNDSGVTWVGREFNRAWVGVASSADGTKLAAVVGGGQIYTSTDSGVTWIPRESSRNWQSISSSADGVKLLAVGFNTQIYTSTDSGLTWTARESSRLWQSAASSADGTKLVAAANGNLIYVSSDSGVTWVSRESSRAWGRVTSSADGTRLAAYVNSGQIYVSWDSGLTWTARDSNRVWFYLASSADGTRLAATTLGGQIYVSTDSGVTWIAQDSNRDWRVIASSSDGRRLVAVVNAGQIYTYADPAPSIQIQGVFGGSSPFWYPVVAWNNIATCYYSFDGFTSTSTVSCSSNGLTIPNPGYGTYTLSVRGIDVNGGILHASSTFSFTPGIAISSPIANSAATSWSPVVNWDPAGAGNITTCQYSYNAFVSTSTASCSLAGADILAPTTLGATTTLSVRVVDANGFVGTSSVSFFYTQPYAWNQRESSRSWQSIASSADGTNIIAGDNGYVYTSTDSGNTWTQRTTSGSRYWRSMAASSDGTKIVGGAWGDYIYTSTTSGATWVARTVPGIRNWISVTSSADGVNLTAYAWGDTNTGVLWTSSDSGANWTSRGSIGTGYIRTMAASSDGLKLIAVDNANLGAGSIYTSINGGANWTQRTGAGARTWVASAISADGTKMAATASNGQIWISTDSGVTWAARAANRAWISVAFSSDASKMIAVVTNGQVWVSNDGGLTWAAQDSSRNWIYVTSSSDGSKLAAVVSGGFIYTFNSSFSITRPALSSTVLNRNWSPAVNWGGATSCYYSYDNFVSTSTVSCANGGSDIAAPVWDGVSALYARGLDGSGNWFNANATFTYEPWTARDSNRNWQGIAASSDGTKLAAVLQGTSTLYVSVDSGATWTANTSAGSRTWNSVAMSSDGTKLVAVVNGGQIYTSTDSGATWTARESNRAWMDVTSSADGTKLVTMVYGGQIYTSTDSGATWTPRDSNRNWITIDSSADGVNLITAVQNGNIYTSSDSGANWTVRSAVGTANWRVVSMSSDGSKAAIAAFAGRIYTSTDYGATWTPRESSRSWYAVTSSADGTKLTAVVEFGQIYSSTDSGVTWFTRDSATTRRYFKVASSDDGNRVFAQVLGGQIYTSVSVPTVTIPAPNTTVTSWSPTVSWDRSSSACQYSYNSIVWSSVPCTGTGSDIPAPVTKGGVALSVRGMDRGGVVSTSSTSFLYDYAWNPHDSSRNWRSVASSADGTKLAAVAQGGQIYTSTDSGATWTARESGRNWFSVVSSADGAKLAAVVANGQIYTSTDSGATWTARESSKQWYSIASSADGTKLVAVALSGQVYTSTDSGATWTARESGRNWVSVASSADGTKLAAVVNNGQVYTSTDSGATWTARESGRGWIGVASSADGAKLAAVVNGGQIYTSTDSGATWTARESNRAWLSVASSADGTRLVAGVNAGQIYTSTDSGATWMAKGPSMSWYGVVSSADGSRLVAVAYAGGQIYTYNNETQASSISLILPLATSTLTSWRPVIVWNGFATCHYSYDGFISTSTVSCLNNGSDILPPSSAGTSTLSLRGIDSNGSMYSSSASFSYVPILAAGSISSCGTISASGTYTLSSDVTGVVGSCFTVSADDVTINGAGHSVTAVGGNSNFAVSAVGRTGLILNDIIFNGFGAGVTASSVTYSGADVIVSTTTASSTLITYSNALSALGAYFSDLSNLIINSVDLQAFVAGIFSWSDQTVSACGTLSSSGTYTLTQDITDVVGTCFTVTARAVIIDGNGHTISGALGNTDFAVTSTVSNADAVRNVGIKDLTIAGFGGGIDARGAAGVSGNVTGRSGGSVSLYNVTFPSDTVSADTSGGNGFYEGGIAAAGGNAGSIKVSSSTLGTINLNGGNAVGDFLIGLPNGTAMGGTAGTVSDSDSIVTITTANHGANYIPGCTNSSYDNYDANATYDDGTCVSLGVGTERDNRVGQTASGPIYFRGFSNRGVVDGDAYYYGYDQYYNFFTPGQGNYGTTTGFGYFYDDWTWSGGPDNYGYVGGGASFEGGNTNNYGVIDGSVYFNTYGSNYGTINGYADFGGGGYEVYNYGTVNGDAIFHHSPDDYNGYPDYNQGTVTGAVSYYYGCTDPSAGNYNSSALNEDGSCYYYGSSADLPGGVTYTGDLNFYGYSNYGKVDGNAGFYYGGFNFGEITGQAYFADYFGDGSGNLYIDGNFNFNGTGLVGGGVYDGDNNPINYFYFNGSDNYWNITGTADFTQGGSYATYNYGTVYGDAVFYDRGYNQGTVTGAASYYYGCLDASAANYDPGVLNAEGQNNDNSRCLYYGVNLDFPEGMTHAGNLDFSGGYNNYGTVDGNATFSGSSENFGTVTGDATYYDAAGGVMSFVGNQTWNGTIGGLIRGGDGIEITSMVFNDESTSEGVIPSSVSSVFNDASINNGTVNGTVSFYGSSRNAGTTNAATTFYGSSYNEGTVTGDATFERAEAGTLTFAGSMKWGGSVGGTVRGFDNVAVSNFVFTGASTNETTIAPNISVTFSQAASNNGTIQGDAAFSNTSPFRIGTVNGTATLVGGSQTITGLNSVVNFVKSVFSRDTLYLSSGSTLNVSGLFTLLGGGANSLLTVRSTVPGSYANIGVNGSAAFDFLRLKDVNNTGSAVSLVGKTAYDDGHNAGFSFNPNSSSGSRSGLTSGASRPSTPVTRAAAAAQARPAPAPARASAGSSEALREFRKATALSLSTVSLPVSLVGRLPALAPLPVFGGTGKGSFSFESPVARFLFEPLPAPLAKSLAPYPRLSAWLASAGVTGAQGLVRISAQPLSVGATQADMPGIYSVSVGGKATPTQMSSDGRSSVFQTASVAAGTTFEVSLSPAGKGAVTGRFDGKAISFDGSNSVELVAPKVPGTYALTSSGSPIGLTIRVTGVARAASGPASAGAATRPTLWERVKGFFLGAR